MIEYRPFIGDPTQIASLRGQRYVVLRAAGAVYDAYRQVEAEVRTHLHGLPVSYPAEPHVTLAGFDPATPENALQHLVSDWAINVAPLDIRPQGVSLFPQPFQIVIVEVRRTPALARAMLTLRAEATRRGLRDLSPIAWEDWRFHMSVAYCSALAPKEWADISRWAETVVVPDVRGLLAEVEMVTFEGEREVNLGRVRLGR